jgi:anti-sigma factor ChrR (cupin superfamily)
MRPMHPTDVTLGDYLDDTLAPSARAQVDAHLAACVECRELVADLREVGRAVATLEPVKPPARTWGRIAKALALAQATDRPATSPVRRRATAGRYLTGLAAAAALVLATFVGLRIARPVPGPAATATSESTTAQSVEAELAQAEQHYRKAIGGLEQIANAGKGALDPQTAAMLAKNLAVVDQAISESRAALTAQPESQPAQASLLDNFRTKIALLQTAVSLIDDMRKGEGT